MKNKNNNNKIKAETSHNKTTEASKIIVTCWVKSQRVQMCFKTSF